MIVKKLKEKLDKNPNAKRFYLDWNDYKQYIYEMWALMSSPPADWKVLITPFVTFRGIKVFPKSKDKK